MRLYSYSILVSIFLVYSLAVAEPREIGPLVFAAPVSKGGVALKAFQVKNDKLRPFFALKPFGAKFRGGVRVAAGDVNGDGTPDLVAATGPGSVAKVRVFDLGTRKMISGALAEFAPFSDLEFRGGVNVAVGDVNGDGFGDVIVGPAGSAAPLVRILNGQSGAEICSFLAYDQAYQGGINVGAGDFDGDGRAEILTGPSSGAAPEVKVFQGTTGRLFSNFFAYDTGFTGGVRVAAGDVNGDGADDIITAPGSGLAPTVKFFNRDLGAELFSFSAYSPAFAAGVYVAAGDVDGDGITDLVTAPGRGCQPIRVYPVFSNIPVLKRIFSEDRRTCKQGLIVLVVPKITVPE